MSNKELITCDYAGCTKPFAYRTKGFNLCYEHCVNEIQSHEAMMRYMEDAMKKADSAQKGSER